MWIVLLRHTEGDASGDTTLVYGPFYDLETAHDFGYHEFGDNGTWSIYQVRKPGGTNETR